MTPERAKELYEGASTLPDAKAFLVARGFPEMAQYLCDVVLPNMPPITRPNECRTKAILCETGSTPGCLAFREKDPATVAKALRWLAEVCERGMSKAAEEWAARSVRLDWEIETPAKKEPATRRNTRAKWSR